jgi:hypothetical protein
MTILSNGDKAMIDRIVGRMHVGDRDRDVLRGLMRTLWKGWRNLIKCPRAKRRAVWRHALRVHRYNRGMFLRVSSGI